MHPDDRVLVNVIKRKRDLNILLKDKWCHIPQHQMPDGIYSEYVAFYLSRSAAKKFDSSGIYYYAERRGVELAYRRDLFPQETNHTRADNVYYKVQFSSIEGKHPPVTNPTKRSISFILTTWDRFVNAKVIADLYSTSDYYVDRIYHALRDKQVRAVRYWDAQKKEYGHGAALRFVCEGGTLTAYTEAVYQDADGIYLDPETADDEILQEIRARIASMGGPATILLPPTR
jgi:hypothetical protein